MLPPSAPPPLPSYSSSTLLRTEQRSNRYWPHIPCSHPIPSIQFAKEDQLTHSGSTTSHLYCLQYILPTVLLPLIVLSLDLSPYLSCRSHCSTTGPNLFIGRLLRHFTPFGKSSINVGGICKSSSAPLSLNGLHPLHLIYSYIHLNNNQCAFTSHQHPLMSSSCTTQTSRFIQIRQAYARPSIFYIIPVPKSLRRIITIYICQSKRLFSSWTTSSSHHTEGISRQH
jgi:hypothetical protein